MIFFGTQTEEG